MKRSHAQKVLFEMIRGFEDLVKILESPRKASLSYTDYLDRVRTFERARRKKVLYQLRRQKMISFTTGKRIEISQGALDRFLTDLIATKRSKLPGDDQCLVSFDIPNSKSRLRDRFRSILKQGKFRQAHQSLWITKRDVAVELMHFILRNHATKMIKVFIAKELK